MGGWEGGERRDDRWVPLDTASVRGDDGEVEVTGRGRGSWSRRDNVVSGPVMPLMKCH